MINTKNNNHNNIEDVAKYVSNIDKDIYTISSLPEEVIAVIFAYVSRSPKSFRENLLKVTKEKASQFHEKWVLAYGHSSVAELASVHIGIENVSRLFSAVLERSNLYISPIEYSQRYQKPKKENFYCPVSENKTKEIYKKYQNQIYETYEKLLAKLIEYYQENEKPKENEKYKTFKSRIEKTSFEDARYILTLGTYTNLGLTANARACEDMLKTMLSSEYKEVVERSGELKKEILQNLPTLIKYAKNNDFISKSREIIKKENYKIEKLIEKEPKRYQISARLLNFTGEKEIEPEDYALNRIIIEMLYAQSQNNIDNITKQINKLSKTTKLNIYNKIFKELKAHDNPLSILQNINYKFELSMSEACWHQFLRHRKVHCISKYPSINNGYIIPESIKEAGITNIFEQGIKKSEELFTLLLSKSANNLDAHYAVTNSHIRKVIASFSLYELYHLINLRMKPQAQWEIRNLIKAIVKEINKVHPDLTIPALDRC